MNPEASVHTIFNNALELQDPAARARYLQEACAGDAALFGRVEKLLRAHGEAGGFFSQPLKPAAPAPPASTIVLPVTEKAGDTIGRYKLLEQIGEGGCGVVYMAEQQQPVRRRVALKVIKLGMDTKQVVGRFEAERQALALMDHPSIARVLDAGSTNSGRPYFVMELVRGIKITEFCDRKRLSTGERLALFTRVCQAVQHAHQKGIIHRDIKPSNILVTMVDGAPVPKVIDFGIAKATNNQPLTDKTLFTAFEQFIGTPAYMSPEQAELSGVDIDTRTDIYSLGVVLYELLTGETPFDAEALLRAGLDEIRRTIRDQEPPRPSTRLHALSPADLTTTAQARQTDAPKLIHQVRGDLDWIVMKCLEKDRARRYETANGLARDIERHLKCEPVVARPPSRLYEFQKTVRRHKFGFAAAGAVVLALAVGLGVSTWQFVQKNRAYHRATKAERDQSRLREQAQRDRVQAEANEQKAAMEAAKSRQVAMFLQEMLKGVGPSVAMGRDTAMLKEILDKTAGRIGVDLKNQPQVEAELRSTLGATYIELGEFAAAETMAREALRIRRNTLEESDPLVATAMVQLASALAKRNQSNDTVEAEALVSEALATQRELRGEEQADRVGWVALHAGVLNRLKRFPEAEIASRRALAMRREIHGQEHRDVASSLDNLSMVLRDSGKLDEAEQAVREALAMQRKLLGSESVDTATSLQYLGGILGRQKRMPEAEAAYREALAVRRKIYGADNVYTATLLSDLASALASQGKHSEATSLFRELVAVRRKIHGETHRNVELALGSLARSLEAEEKLAEAEAVWREELAVERRLFGDDHVFVANTLHDLARVLMNAGRLGEAELVCREALEIRRKSSGNEHPLTRSALIWLDSALRRQGKHAEAVILLQEELDHARAADGKGWASTNSGLGMVLHHFAESLWNQKAFKEARPPAEQAWALYQQHPDWPENERSHAYRVLHAVLTSLNDQPALESVLRDELVRLRGKLPAEDPKLAEFLATFALDLMARQKFAEAEAPAREALAIREKAAPDEWRTFNSRSLLGASLLGQKKYAEAEPFLLSGFEGMKQREQSIPAAGKVRIPEALQRLVQLYDATGQPEKAAEWNKKLAEFDKGEAEKQVAPPKP